MAVVGLISFGVVVYLIKPLSPADIRRAERRIGGKVHPVGVVPERYPDPVEHVRGQVPDREPAGVRGRGLASPAGYRQVEPDAPGAGGVVHAVGEGYVLGATL